MLRNLSTLLQQLTDGLDTDTLAICTFMNPFIPRAVDFKWNKMVKSSKYQG